MRTQVQRIVDGLGLLAAYGFAVVVVITAYEVLMRYVFASPTTWVHELSIAISAAAFAIGGPYAMRQDAHLRISALRDRAGPRLRLASTVLSIACGVVFLGGLLYAFVVRAFETGWRFEEGHWAPETTGRAWDVPIPPFMHATLAACCLLFIVLLFTKPDKTPSD